MNNRQIERLLSTNIITRNAFVSVHAADCLPERERRRKPCAYVVNTDEISGPGKHWVCIYFPKSKPVEYFDSFGLYPKKYFIEFMKNDFLFHSNFLQQVNSTVCGQYCIAYIYLRCKGLCMAEILNLFNVYDPLGNDCYVNHIVKNEFGESYDIFDNNFLQKQIGKAYNDSIHENQCPYNCL